MRMVPSLEGNAFYCIGLAGDDADAAADDTNGRGRGI